MNFQVLKPIPLLIIASLLLSSCAQTRRKVEVGNILKKCTLDLATVSLDSLRLEPDVAAALRPQQGSFLPDPKIIGWMQELATGTLERSLGTAWVRVDLILGNVGKDTLWLYGGDADVRMGELQTKVRILPGRYRSVPGTVIVPVQFPVTLDGKLMQVAKVDTLYMRGTLIAAPDTLGNPLSLGFDERKVLPKGTMQQFVAKAKEEALRNAIDRWSTDLVK